MTVSRQTRLMSIKEMVSQAHRSPEKAYSYLENVFNRINAGSRENAFFITVSKNRAFERATALQSILPQIRTNMPLFGVPFAVKDNIDVQDSITTCGSASMPRIPASSSAAVVRRLEVAGAICIGKTVMSEFSLGEVPSHVPWSELINPIMPTHLPGSSSQGSTAVVASGLIPFSIGTDTGGSIRHPAAAMGVYGLKPTNGSLDLDGVFPLSHSLDTAGPIAGSLEDLETVCRPLFQLEDSYSSSENTLKIGFPESLWTSEPNADPQIKSEMENIRNLLNCNGIHVIDAKLPPLVEFQRVGWKILNYEGYQGHASILNEKSAQCGDMFIEHMEAGRATSHKDYLAAMSRAKELASSVDKALDDVDFLVSPISFRRLPRVDARDDIEHYNSSAIRIIFNISGHPALVTPLPLAKIGVPFAVQWAAKRFSEKMYFSSEFKMIDRLVRESRYFS